jgi:hypothetical protein
MFARKEARGRNEWLEARLADEGLTPVELYVVKAALAERGRDLLLEVGGSAR